MFFNKNNTSNTIIVDRKDILKMLENQTYFFKKPNNIKNCNCLHISTQSPRPHFKFYDKSFMDNEQPLGSVIKNQSMLSHYQKLPEQIIKYFLVNSKAAEKLVILENLDEKQLNNIVKLTIPVTSCSIVCYFKPNFSSQLFKDSFAELTRKYKIDSLKIKFLPQYVVPSIKSSTQIKYKDIPVNVIKVAPSYMKITWDLNQQISMETPLQLKTTLNIYKNLPSQNTKELILDCDDLSLDNLKYLDLYAKIGHFMQPDSPTCIILNKGILDDKKKLMLVMEKLRDGMHDSNRDGQIILCDIQGIPYGELGEIVESPSTIIGNKRLHSDLEEEGETSTENQPQIKKQKINYSNTPQFK